METDKIQDEIKRFAEKVVAPLERKARKDMMTAKETLERAKIEASAIVAKAFSEASDIRAATSKHKEAVYNDLAKKSQALSKMEKILAQNIENNEKRSTALADREHSLNAREQAAEIKEKMLNEKAAKLKAAVGDL